jgi:ERCC4-type nuclease
MATSKKKTAKKKAKKKTTTKKKALPDKQRFTVIRDSREHEGHGYVFEDKGKACAGTTISKLDYGDYSVEGLEDFVIIERKKSIDELAHCLSSDRERFYRELDAMSHVAHRYILVEDYWSAVGWQTKVGRHSKMHPNAFMSTIFSLMMRHGIQVIFAGSPKNAKRIAYWILQKAHKYYTEEQCQDT